MKQRSSILLFIYIPKVNFSFFPHSAYPTSSTDSHKPRRRLFPQKYEKSIMYQSRQIQYFAWLRLSDTSANRGKGAVVSLIDIYLDSRAETVHRSIFDRWNTRILTGTTQYVYGPGTKTVRERIPWRGYISAIGVCFTAPSVRVHYKQCPHKSGGLRTRDRRWDCRLCFASGKERRSHLNDDEWSNSVDEIARWTVSVSFLMSFFNLFFFQWIKLEKFYIWYILQ